jgi:hypothetical protein
MIAHARKLGHTIHVVRSMQEFLAIAAITMPGALIEVKECE